MYLIDTNVLLYNNMMKNNSINNDYATDRPYENQSVSYYHSPLKRPIGKLNINFK